MKTRILVAVVSLILTSACATGNLPPGYTPLTDSEKQKDVGLPGLEVKAPQQGEWAVAYKNADVEFYKKTSPTHTYVVIAGYAKEPDFAKLNDKDLLESGTKKWEEGADLPRWKHEVITGEITNKFGPRTLYFHKRSKDYGPNNNTRQGKYLILEDHNYLFVHPYIPEYCINILYSERFAEGEENAKVSAAEREQFLKGIKPRPF